VAPQRWHPPPLHLSAPLLRRPCAYEGTLEMKVYRRHPLVEQFLDLELRRRVQIKHWRNSLLQRYREEIDQCDPYVLHRGRPLYHMPLAWPAIGLPSCVRDHHLIQLLYSQSIGFLDMCVSIRSWYLLTQNKMYWKHPKSLFRYSYDGIVSIAAVETTVPPTNVQSI
jgi:hypothetical protein